MDEEPERAKRWEGGYERTWEVLKEDESGSLKATVEDILFQSKRKRVIENHGQVRLGMMRHLYVLIDCSRSMEDQDLKPNRLASTLKLMEAFVDEYFDQNPISQVGIITTKNKRAEKLTDLAGNPKKHIAALKKAVDTLCVGEPSLYNSLNLAIQTLKHMPGHTSREILIILSSLTTCDPASIYELIKTLKSLKVRVSVIGLSAEVRVCTVLTRETGGSYHVILDESHFRELLMLHVKPPPASSSSECSLIRMGFPQHTIASLTDQGAKPSFSMSHLDNSSGPGLSLEGYFCPQCHAKYTELPVECKVCGLTLVLAPHLARSFHHLFPLQAFTESSVEELQEDRFCQACQGELKDKIGLKPVPIEKVVVTRPKQNRRTEGGIRSILYKGVVGDLLEMSLLNIGDTYQDFDVLEKPLAATMGITVEKTLVETVFGLAQKGSVLSYQQPVVPSKIITIHKAVPPYPAMPREDYRLSPRRCVHVCNEKEDLHITSIMVTQDMALKIEATTRDQAASQEWHLLRKPRITSSHFREVCFVRGVSSAESLAERILKGTRQTGEMRRGVLNNPKPSVQFCH
uniref:General transcription factor IIH, polypeptide 2 n=1 Tax=Sparus aurata TaxID=8175 RepID=A0A671VHI3_SPAAU